MKLKKLWFGLVIMLGTLVAGQQQAKAEQVIVHSFGLPVKIYTDAACTQYSGTNLDTAIDAWAVLKSSKSSNELGKNQWVKGTDVFYDGGRTNSIGSDIKILYGLALNQKVPVYDSPQFWQTTSYLEPSINKWAVTGYARKSPAFLPIDRLDLGHNQWVSTEDVTPIFDKGLFTIGVPLYNSKGHQTGTLQGSDNVEMYKIFDATLIGNEAYVKLGTNDQWIKYSSLLYN